MGSRYRCRVSPSGVPGCIPGLGTGGTGEGAQLGGALALVGDIPFSTEGLNFIPIPSALWQPRDLLEFADLGDGQLQYVGGVEKTFLVSGGISANTVTTDILFLSYGINGTAFPLEILASSTSTVGSVETLTIFDVVTLSPSDILQLFVSTIGGADFNIFQAQIAATALGS